MTVGKALRLSSLAAILPILVAVAALAGEEGVRVLVASLSAGAGVADEAGQGGRDGDTQYCDPLPDHPDPPPQPTVASRYTAKVELTRAVLGQPYTSMHHLGTNNECILRPLEEATYLFPVLMGSGLNLSTDHIMDPAVPLGILSWPDAHYKGTDRFREMDTFRWDWCGLKQFEADAGTPNVSMATYWSASNWHVGGSGGVAVPLGWEVEVLQAQADGGTTSTKQLVHNIMYFRSGDLDYSTFTIPQDVYCSTLIPEPGHPFPDFSEDILFTFSLEMHQTTVHDFSWADAWYDFQKQLYRIDHDVVTRAKEIVPTTEVFDFNDGIEFSFATGSMSSGCVVSIINDSRTDWSDITGISLLWADNPNAFFGSDITHYTYYGPGATRYVEGQEWRALRTDWPVDATGGDTTTLWQWTFANKNVTTVTDMGDHLLEERQVPIGLRVTAIHDIETVDGVIPAGSAFVYQLYNFDLESGARSDDAETDGGDFDTYDCYSANWRDHLMFKLDVSSWPEVVWTPLLTSSLTNEHWQTQLAHYGRVSVIRITRVKTISEASGEVWVEFVLLYRHPKISELDPQLYTHMTPGREAKTYISAAVNNGSINLEGHKPDGQTFLLVAVHGSLAPVIEPDCTSTTTPSTTTITNPGHSTTTIATPGHSTTTTSGHSTTTATTYTDRVSTSTATMNPVNTGDLYTSGDLAGIGVGLLVSGLALGAGGTFLVVVKKVHHTVLGWCTKI
nr:uncharacterized protein LOC123769279 isoform X2 [Procambarus clarkii]